MAAAGQYLPVTRLGPRLIIAGTHSGVGKTTVATGIMGALAQRGLVVAAAKVGPDFIDPGYHAIATGRPGRNLDPWMSGTEAIRPLAGRAASRADVLVVEGVMGLFDGAGDPDGPTASTAQVAGLLEAPVVLVVDASSLSGSVAAVVHGYSTFDPALRVAGVVLNRVASDGHEALLREALALIDMPVLGCLRRDAALSWRDRHLGLVPVVEDRGTVRQSVQALAAAVERHCELDALLAIARSAEPVVTAPSPRAWNQRRRSHPERIAVAVAGGPAFSFYYPDNLEALEQAGAELAVFDPADDSRLPAGTHALYAGGGFPEVFAESLAGNRSLLNDVRQRIAAGMPTWAECGGLLWLARSLDGRRLAGAVPADARMTDRLVLGYRRVRPAVDTPLAPAAAELRGHEFHYSVLEPPGSGFEWRGRSGSGIFGYAGQALFASYVHLHLGSDPAPAERFVRAAGGIRDIGPTMP